MTEKDYWNSGIFFKHSNSETYALVDTNLYSRQIDCWIKGENTRGFWEVIRNDFREIFKMYHNFPVTEEIEYVSGNRTVFLPYQEMLDSLKNGINIIEYHPSYQLKKIDVQYVLELFESPEQTNKLIDNERLRIDINPKIEITNLMTPINEIQTEITNLVTSTHETQSSSMNNNNPWISGSFYLFLGIIVISGLAVISNLIPWSTLPLIIIGGILIIGIIGALQLRNDDKLKEEGFLKLMIETYKRLPLLKSSKNK